MPRMSLLTDAISYAAPPAFNVGARILPAPAIALTGALTANLLLGTDEVLAPLSGCRICLEVVTPSLKLGFVIRGSRLWPAPPTPWDVCIRGEMRSFLALLLQTEDADALFFDRQLSVEGKTEVALHIRHALEGAIYRRQKWLRGLFRPSSK